MNSEILCLETPINEPFSYISWYVNQTRSMNPLSYKYLVISFLPNTPYPEELLMQIEFFLRKNFTPSLKVLHRTIAEA